MKHASRVSWVSTAYIARPNFFSSGSCLNRCSFSTSARSRSGSPRVVKTTSALRSSAGMVSSNRTVPKSFGRHDADQVEQLGGDRVVGEIGEMSHERAEAADRVLAHVLGLQQTGQLDTTRLDRVDVQHQCEQRLHHACALLRAQDADGIQ